MWKGKPAERTVRRLVLQDANWTPIDFAEDIVHYRVRNLDNAGNLLEATYEDNPGNKPVATTQPINSFFIPSLTLGLAESTHEEDGRPDTFNVRRTVVAQEVYVEAIRYTTPDSPQFQEA